MPRMLSVRLVLTAIAVVVWGYGYRYDVAGARLAAIVLLVVSLALRFVPARGLGDAARP